jgi:hypothetical protein
MRISGLLSVFAFVLLFSSCSKDKDNISGNWDATSLVATQCDDPEDNQNLSFTDGCFSESLFGLEIKVCLTARFTDETFTITSIYSFAGESETETQSGTYTISGDKITLKSSDGESTEGTLNKKRDEMTITDMDDDGCITTIKLKKK